jgi:hypothetical protein
MPTPQCRGKRLTRYGPDQALIVKLPEPCRFISQGLEGGLGGTAMYWQAFVYSKKGLSDCAWRNLFPSCEMETVPGVFRKNAEYLATKERYQQIGTEPTVGGKCASSHSNGARAADGPHSPLVQGSDPCDRRTARIMLVCSRARGVRGHFLLCLRVLVIDRAFARMLLTLAAFAQSNAAKQHAELTVLHTNVSEGQAKHRAQADTVGGRSSSSPSRARPPSAFLFLCRQGVRHHLALYLPLTLTVVVDTGVARASFGYAVEGRDGAGTCARKCACAWRVCGACVIWLIRFGQVGATPSLAPDFKRRMRLEVLHVRERLNLLVDQVHIKQEHIKIESAKSSCVSGVTSLLCTYSPRACAVISLRCVARNMQSCMTMRLCMYFLMQGGGACTGGSEGPGVDKRRMQVCITSTHVWIFAACSRGVTLSLTQDIKKQSRLEVLHVRERLNLLVDEVHIKQERILFESATPPCVSRVIFSWCTQLRVPLLLCVFQGMRTRVELILLFLLFCAGWWSI